MNGLLDAMSTAVRPWTETKRVEPMTKFSKKKQEQIDKCLSCNLPECHIDNWGNCLADSYMEKMRKEQAKSVKFQDYDKTVLQMLKEHWPDHWIKHDLNLTSEKLRRSKMRLKKAGMLKDYD